MALLNLRDVATSQGTAPLAPGRLFRSGQPYDLAETDIASIEDAVDTIVDLRDASEARAGEWALMERHGATIVHIPLAGQVIAPSEAHGNLLGAFYVSMLDGGAQRLAQVARTVAAADGVLLHCAAGKDRTGVATALLLDLIGVPRSAIVGDYELTNAAMASVIAQLAEVYGMAGGTISAAAAAGAVGEKLDATVDAAAATASELEQAPAAELPGIPPELFTAPAAAIEMFLQALAKRGGARSYLAAAGLSESELDAVVAYLTAA